LTDKKEGLVEANLQHVIRENTAHWMCLKDQLFKGMTQKGVDRFISMACDPVSFRYQTCKQTQWVKTKGKRKKNADLEVWENLQIFNVSDNCKAILKDQQKPGILIKQQHAFF
jgi:hypothetical protein